MRIREIFLDFLNETALFEMAFERKIAIQKARNLQNQIIRHIIKVYMYDKSEYVNHWCKEINGSLWDIQDNWVKGTKMPLDRDTLFKILFSEPVDSIDEVQHKMNRIYKEYPTLQINEPDASSIHKNIYTVIDLVCGDISNNNFNDIKDYLGFSE